ncbi:NUDIX hydrolase [Paenibacillus sp. NPDC056579]|uniref:NUDIX hydrolase n=1 Tax=unclassified Paenibacillus TaxID=185978 RepID=UPI001EF90265|nr:NUDIX hydrolase [Paenibacillus sp. H1-7]ULL16166.1 NUDIX hydrolase [Paenibacillus sp. H1-7]
MDKVEIRGAKIVVIHNNQLVVVKQSRAGKKGPTYELPGGRIEKHEDIAAGAIRELREETGLISKELIPLGTFSIPTSPIVITLFFTNKIIGKVEQNLDADEDIEVIYVSIDEAFKKIANHTWTDSRLAIGLFLARARGLLN